MLEFILLLFGLIFPSNDINTATTSENPTQVKTVKSTRMYDTTESDTGGTTAQIPPK